jgi:hypothetical protein
MEGNVNRKLKLCSVIGLADGLLKSHKSFTQITSDETIEISGELLGCDVCLWFRDYDNTNFEFN